MSHPHPHPEHDGAHRHDHDHDHGHDHGHGHVHGHHHAHSHAPATFGKAFAIGITLNTAYVVAEAIYGVLANSLSLLADAGHNFGDVLGLAAAWIAAWLGRRPPSARYTYGLRSSTILAALSNATVLMLVTGAIAWEAVMRFMHPEPTAGLTVMVVSAGGVLVNGFTALLFMSGRKGDLNIRGAFLHMASDAVVSLGVIATGAAILLTGWRWLDPAISLVVSGVIVWGTWSLLRESLDLALHAVPAAVDEAAVSAYLATLPGVSEVHDLHIWGMSTTETALTAHLVRPGGALDDDLLRTACGELRARFAIGHATLQIEAGDGAHPRRRAGAPGPVRHRLAIAHERRIEEDDLPPGLRRPGREFIEAADHQDRGGDSLFGRPDAATQAEHGEAHGAGIDQLDRLAAPDPVRYLDRLRFRVVQPVPLHLGQDPIDGAFEACRAAQPVAEAVHQLGQPLVRGAVGEGGADDPVGHRAVRCHHAVGGLGGERGRGDTEQRGEYNRMESGHARKISGSGGGRKREAVHVPA